MLETTFQVEDTTTAVEVVVESKLQKELTHLVADYLDVLKQEELVKKEKEALRLMIGKKLKDQPRVNLPLLKKSVYLIPKTSSKLDEQKALAWVRKKRLATSYTTISLNTSQFTQDYKKKAFSESEMKQIKEFYSTNKYTTLDIRPLND